VNASIGDVAFALFAAAGGLWMAARPSWWQESMVGVFGDTRLGAFYRSDAYRVILRIGGGIVLCGGIAFALSVPSPPEQGQSIEGLSGRRFTLLRTATVASDDFRGKVVCVVEPDLETAWDVARYVGRLDDGAAFDFAVASSVRRFVLPVRAPQMTAIVFSQETPGAWRLASRDFRARVQRVTARVCVLSEHTDP